MLQIHDTGFNEVNSMYKAKQLDMLLENNNNNKKVYVNDHLGKSLGLQIYMIMLMIYLL